MFLTYITNDFDIRLLADGVVEHIPPDSGGVRNQHANLFLLQSASLWSRMLAKSWCATQGPEGSNFGAGTFLPVWRSRGLDRTSPGRVQVLNLTRWFAGVRKKSCSVSPLPLNNNLSDYVELESGRCDSSFSWVPPMGTLDPTSWANIARFLDCVFCRMLCTWFLTV